jgi:hypothetical protein
MDAAGEEWRKRVESTREKWVKHMETGSTHRWTVVNNAKIFLRRQKKIKIN